MKDIELPCGDVIYFEGNLFSFKPDALAFCYCEVTAPDHLDHPFLQVHIKNKTVAGLGTFEGVFYSKEIKHALTLGYKIKILHGFYFTKSIKLFSNYVDTLYEIRQTFDKSDPMNYISKLLLNSLYGRMAMDDRHNSIKVYDEKEFKQNMKKNDLYSKIADIEFFKEVKKVVVETKLERFTNAFNSNYENHITSIPIAAAITAEARIYMSQFKNNPNFKLYYTDTDSIFIDKSPEEMNKLFPGIINDKELGKLKHEFTVKNAVFLGPKCYWLQLDNGQEIIKIKGVKNEFINKARDENNLDFDIFKELLKKDASLNIAQEKWFRNYSDATINIVKTSYEIKQNDNKRELIYENGTCVATKPIIFDKETFNKEINKNFF